MSLPERLYYPLDKAAKKLNCDISDIIHLAANGYVSLCFKLINHPMSESNIQFKLFPDIDEDALDQYVRDELESTLSEIELWHSFSNSYCEYGGKFKLFLENGKVTRYLFDLERYMGLIKIGKTDIYRGEMSLLNEELIEIGWLSTPHDINSSPVGFFEPMFSDESQPLPFVLDNRKEQGAAIMITYEVSDLVKVCIDDLFITQSEIARIEKGERDHFESDKTIAKKGELIPPLLRMLPDFNCVDLDSLPVSKIKDMVEAIAAEKGVEFPNIHRQTWQKYLGRNRLIR